MSLDAIITRIFFEALLVSDLAVPCFSAFWWEKSLQYSAAGRPGTMKRTMAMQPTRIQATKLAPRSSALLGCPARGADWLVRSLLLRHPPLLSSSFSGLLRSNFWCSAGLAKSPQPKQQQEARKKSSRVSGVALEDDVVEDLILSSDDDEAPDGDLLSEDEDHEPDDPDMEAPNKKRKKPSAPTPSRGKGGPRSKRMKRRKSQRA